MKKFFAVLLILIIIALVLTVVGAGILVLNENKRVLGLPVCWVNRTTSKQVALQERSETETKLDAALFNSTDTKYIINSDSFDVSVNFIDISDTSKYLYFSEENIYIMMSSKVMGFTTEEDTQVSWSVKGDVDKKEVLISTKQPSGWLFTNRCTLDVYIPRANIPNLQIKTDGKVKVNEGFTKVDNLTITSKNNKENNAMVHCPVGNFTLNNPNGSGNYDTFDGNLTLNSDYGWFTFNRINGKAIINGISADVTITTLNGDLEYNVDYGRGTFETIIGSAIFKCKSSDVTINKDLLGSITVTEGGNSNFYIKSNLGVNAGSNNQVNMNKGKFVLEDTYCKTIVNSIAGEVKILNAHNQILINPKNEPTDVISSTATVTVSFGVVESTNYPSSSDDYLLTVYTKGTITATNLVSRVFIEGLENKAIKLQFKAVEDTSKITAASGEVFITYPNTTKFTIEATVKEERYCKVDEGSVGADSVSTLTNGMKLLTYQLNKNATNGNLNNKIIVQTYETVMFTPQAAN